LICRLRGFTLASLGFLVASANCGECVTVMEVIGTFGQFHRLIITIYVCLCRTTVYMVVYHQLCVELDGKETAQISLRNDQGKIRSSLYKSTTISQSFHSISSFQRNKNHKPALGKPISPKSSNHDIQRPLGKRQMRHNLRFPPDPPFR